MGPLSFGFRRRAAAALEAENAEKERLRREDHLRVKHDKLFSDWKILVGPTNWSDHAAGEEGSQRYNIHNLPASYFGPGVYELGLTQHTYVASEGKRQRKIRRQAVLVVYLGQADNVRQRLQRYGQTGSHLEGKRSGSETALGDVQIKQQQTLQSMYAQGEKRGLVSESVTKQPRSEGGLHLFTEVFSRGYSIAFRWARTESKQVAEKVESELLHVFDYPWNSALNGARRPRDILTKLELLQYHLERNLCLGRAVGVGWRKWEYLSRNVGISVAVWKPVEASRACQPEHRRKFSVLFTSTDSPQNSCDGANQGTSVCGVLLEDGSTCNSAALKGHKRCNEHESKKAQASTRYTRAKPANARIGRVKKPIAVVTIRSRGRSNRVETADVSTGLVCGAIVDGGAPCRKLPVEGRKRCSEHKGLRIGSSRPRAKMVTTIRSARFSGPKAKLRKRKSGLASLPRVSASHRVHFTR